jgi:SsrA-binding protein
MSISNRSAYHDYHIEDTYNAGMVLLGTEIKSMREGKVSFNDSYCLFHKNELWIKSLYIGEYTHGTDNNHIATRDRKLLLNRREMDKIQTRMKEKGYTLVPLKIFFNDKSLAKMEIGLGKGKKAYDKRESLKEKDSQREMQRYLKR